jgi:uncharacterized RmlC-like cupin family protein
MRLFAFMLILVLAGADAQPAFAGDSTQEAEIVVIRPDASISSKQGLPVFQGISGQNAGAKGISMNRVVIPPAGSAKAHMHKGYESVVYLIRGRVKTLYGKGLKKSVINEGGDFLYIPADLPHKPINLSDTEVAEAIVARTDPNEQESIEHVAEPEPVPK